MQTQFPSVRIQNLLRNASDGRFDHRMLIDTVDRECCLTEGWPKCQVVFYLKMGDEVDAEEGREYFKSIAR